MAPQPTKHRFARLAVPASLVAIVALGMLLRFSLIHLPGNEFDVGVNQGWAFSAVQLGVVPSYATQLNGTMLPNYPPFSIYIFAAAGKLYDFLTPQYTLQTPLYLALIKLPAIIADVVIACVLFGLIGNWRGKKWGIVVAAVYLFQPASWYNSAVWGQTDAIFTCLLLGSLACAVYKMPGSSGLFFALAVLTKAQAVVVAPLLFVCIAMLGWRALCKAIGGGILAALIILLPFIKQGKLSLVVNVYTHSVGYYSTLSSAAYNFWWSLFGDKASSIHDSLLLFHTVSYRNVGYALFALVMVGVLTSFVLSMRRKTANASALPILLLHAALIEYGFFLFNVQMHERYLFPYIVFSLPLIFCGWRGIVLYAFTSLLFFFNLMGYLPFGFIDKALFTSFEQLDVFIAVSQVWVFALTALYIFSVTARKTGKHTPRSRKVSARL